MSPLHRTLLALAVLMPWLGFAGFPLFDLDEGAFTASTTEMFLRGDYLSTWLNGAPRHDKPVLAYWLQAASASLAGFSEAGFRLPSVLAGSLWILLTWAFTSRQAGPRAGVLAAVVVAASLGPLLIAKAATADALLNLFLAAAGYAGWLWLEGRGRHWLWWCWAAMALGFLTKGPVAVLVPAGTVLAYLALGQDWKRIRDFLADWRAWTLFLTIAAPWFILLTLRDGLDFLAGFFLTHNLGRFSAPMENHGGSPLYYVPVLFLSLLPFSGLLITLVLGLGKAWHTPWLRFGLLWFLLVFLLFSVSGTKLPHYLYYGYGGLIPVFAWAALEARLSRWLLLPALLAGLAILFLPDILLAFGDALKEDHAEELAALGQHFGASFHLVLILAVAMAAGLMLARQPAVAERLGLAGLALAGAICMALLPATGSLLQGPVRAAGQAARQLEGPLVMVGINMPSFQTYAGRLVSRREPRSGDLVLVPTRRLATLPPRLQTWDFGTVSLARIR